MPTYDYRCTACLHAFEQFQSMTARPLRVCPCCGKPKLERLIGTGAAVLFKGSGFYQTDYRSEGYKKSADAESKPAADTKPAAETKGATAATPSPAAPGPTKQADSKPAKPAAKATRGKQHT
jgi:putative FmdB family regulatory protein